MTVIGLILIVMFDEGRTGIEVLSSLVNTLPNWSLKAFALRYGSLVNCPLMIKSGIPTWSLDLVFFIYDQKDFGFSCIDSVKKSDT